MDENKLLLAELTDKYKQFESYYAIVATDFFSLPQQSLVRAFLREQNISSGYFYGGFQDAERRMVVFVPDYLEIGSEEELIQWFRGNPDDCPVSCLSLTYHVSAGGKVLTHRDYLGSLMGEGIRREKVGDILVQPGGAQIMVAKELGEYLQAHYGKAGRTSLEAKLEPVSAVAEGVIRKEELSLTVSSPRLDNLVSAVFHLSRKDAVTAVERGLVFVDDQEQSKPDKTLKGGEKLVLRGKGKAIYKGEKGTSKKGKLYIAVERYI